MKLIIAGGRDFNNYETLKKFCDYLLQNKTNVEIVSGGAKGADYLGEKYASEKKYMLTKFPANWDKYDKSAGVIRNIEMAKYADALVAFWDKKSRGTQHMIKVAAEYGLDIRIYYYE